MARLTGGATDDGVLPFERKPDGKPQTESFEALRNRWRVTIENVMRSRSKPPPSAQENREAALAVFRPPQAPPPGVLPAGEKPALAMDDAFVNDLSGSFNWAASGYINSAWLEGQAFMGYPMLAILAQRAEYRVFSEIIAQEMTRKWIRFESTSEEDKSDRIKELNDWFSDMRVRDHFRRAAEVDGFFGRGHLYIDTGDQQNLQELATDLGDGRSQLSLAKVSPKRPVKRLAVVEPVWTYPLSYEASDPLDEWWYKPRDWYVMGKRLHCSRLLPFIGREIPDLLKPAYSFGGLSLTQMAKPYVDNWLRTRQSVSDLLHAFTVFVLHTDLSTALMPGADGGDLFNRVDFFNGMRDNRGMMIVDKNTEELSNVSAPLGTLDHLQAQAQEQMCSVGRIPTVKFTGIEPSGLNASSEGSIRVFGETIHGYQEQLFRHHLNTVMWFAMLSLWGEVDKEITAAFVPLAELTELEQSELRNKDADTDGKYIDSGVLWPEDVRTRIAKDPSSPYQGLNPSDVPDLKEEEEQGLVPEGGGRATAELVGGEASEASEAGEEENEPKGEDASPVEAAGVMFVDPTGAVLLMRRADTGEWAFPAGRAEGNETPLQTALREAKEETGYCADMEPIRLDERIVNGVHFHTFKQPVARTFDPVMNNEHTAFAWARRQNLPNPLHAGVEIILNADSGPPASEPATNASSGLPIRKPSGGSQRGKDTLKAERPKEASQPPKANPGGSNEASRAKEAPKKPAPQLTHDETNLVAKFSSKRDLVGHLMEKGTTVGEVLKLTGWPSISMPNYAKKLGLTLTKTKEGGKMTYRGKPGQG